MIRLGLRLIGGDRTTGIAAGEDRHFQLMLAAYDRAAALGLKTRGVKRSKELRSRSVYLHLTDAAGRLWRLRVSDHQKPERTMATHFDLQSLDGVFGRDQLLNFVSAIAAGTAPWFDPEGTGRRISQRKLGRIKRHQK